MSNRELLRESVTSIERLTGRKLFILVRSFDSLLTSIVEKACREMLVNQDTQESGFGLDILLHSSGGLADSAYKSILIFRQFAGHIRVLIPHMAKSAATLFALGADEIVMWSTAELGPLDPQIVDPRNPIRPMSALDGYQSVEYIRDYALETLTVTVSQLLANTHGQMPLSTAINHSTDFLKVIVSPIISQVNPLNFGEWGRNLDISKKYAQRLLERYHLKGRKPREVERIADRLVYGYPHHGFVIDIHEAQQLGLNVSLMPTEQFKAIDEVVRIIVSNFVQPVSYDSLRKEEQGYTGFVPSSTYQSEHPPENDVLQKDGAQGPQPQDHIKQPEEVKAEVKAKEVQAKNEGDKSSGGGLQQSGLSPN